MEKTLTITSGELVMMVLDTIEALRQQLAIHRSAHERIGIVPTMGYLHDGHLSLVYQARQECDVVVLSIFVNPRQFGPQEDLDRYPRDRMRDICLSRKAGVDIVFIPTVDEMYPTGFQSEVRVDGLTEKLCGESRPGHFNGVTTIVAKLFNIVGPERAYFGSKDYQQAIIVKKMVEDLNMPITIVSCPIIREKDGLAMSSRNSFLSSEERQTALVLSRSLQLAATCVAEGERDGKRLQSTVSAYISAYSNTHIDYVAVCDPDSLQAVETLSGDILVALAVRVGKTRLIDNTLVTVT